MAEKRPSEAAIDQVAAGIVEGWAELGIVEHDGTLHMPASIRRRTESGGLQETPVLLRNVSNPQRYRARVMAREWAKERQLDLDRDVDFVEELENYCLLAYAVRDTDGKTQHVPDGQTLWENYDNQCLSELWGRYDAWVRMLHPGFGAWEGEDLWRVIAQIKSGADISPLAAMPGIEQANCVLLMASEACSSPTAPSWVRSSGTSTPED